eukprot:GHVU01121021.1.p1 GENE.GHVU01121021.1~~GHVU01121021.1.p1  ORF type:complete len:297 (+),score=44.00 GHVU01121021.1:84-974(+)
MAELNEMDRILAKKPNLAKNSIKTYTQAYKKLVDILATDNVADLDNTEIIELIDDEENYGTINLLLTIVLMIKYDNDKKFDDIKKHRDVIREEMRESRWKKKEEKLDTLPSIKTLTKYLNRLYSKNQYQSYIINYLLINYNVRNLDLDLILTDDMKEYHNLGKRGDENVLFVGKNNSVYYYRNNYKTKKTYGPKAIRLSSVKLANSIKGYIAQQQAITDGDIYLLSLQDGNRSGRDSLSHYITKFTYEGLTESDIMKIIVTEKVKTIDDYNKLEKISKNRGTAIETLIEEYNLSVY